jgi:N-acetyl-D-muramate 6-phosphate phosphatase
MHTFGNISTILFDLDGTLIDSAPDLAAAADEMRVSRGMASLPLDVYRPMAGAGARGMLGIAFGLTPDAPDYEVLREEFFSNYERCMTQQTYAFDGVLALIDEICQSKFRWGVVTNKSKRFTEPLTQGMPLFSTASVVISGDTTPYAKPHPEPLFEAARRLGVDPAQCVYVGDDERDIVAGLAAGMLTVAATYGYLGTKSDVNAWGAHAQINSPLDLLQLLVST